MAQLNHHQQQRGRGPVGAGQEGYEQWRGQHYYALANEPKAYWVVEGATHCNGPSTQPKTYETRMVTFFDRALLNQ